jgi:hypothetical protein
MIAGEWALPIATAAVFALFVVLDCILLASGAYQVLTGKPSLLVRIVASIRMRLPASPGDCVLQGSAQVLQAVGLFVVLVPSMLPAVASTSELLGAPQLPALSHLPALSYWPELRFAFLAYVLGSLVIGIVCMVVSYALSIRVKYVVDDGAIKVAG